MAEIQEFPIEDNKIQEFPISENSIQEFPVLGASSSKDEQFKKMSLLFKALDIISRPSYAVKSSVEEQIKQEKGEKPYSVAERYKAMWKGLHGYSRPEANRLYKEKGVEGIPGLGFATEVAVDPLTYTPAGVLKVGGKALSKTGQAINKIPGVAKSVDKIAEVSRPATDFFKKSFINSTGNDQLDALVKKHTLNRGYLTNKEFEYGVRVRKVIEGLAKRNKRSVDDISNEVVNLLELGDSAKSTMPQTRVLANTLKNHYERILEKEITSGVKVGALGSGKVSKINTLRNQLNVLREAKRDELFKTRNILIGQIDELSKKKVAQVESELQDEVANIKNKADLINTQKIKSLSDKVDSIDSQLQIYAQHINRLKNAGMPYQKELNAFNRLENEYWYHTGDLAERLQDIPELANKTAFANKINEIENLLSKGLDVSLGREGVSLANKLLKLDKQKQGLIPGFSVGRKGVSLLKELSDIRARRDLGYVPRITSKEAMDYMKSASKSVFGSRAWNPKIKNALSRRTADFTLEEFNDFVAQNGLKSLGGKSVENFFLKNPSYSTAIRGIRSAKAITSMQFLKEADSLFGKDALDAPSHWVEASDNLVDMMPSMKGKFFDPVIMEELNRIYPAVKDKTVWDKILNGYDEFQDYWKSYLLSPIPKYHIRNVIGNMWNNYLGGVVNPVVYARATALQDYKRTGSDRLLKKMNITKEVADELINQAERQGVFKHGFYGSDIPEKIEQSIKPASKNPLSRQGFLIRGGRVLGTELEDHSRLAHFIDKIDKGFSAEDAADSVRKYLFDYNDLTEFERSVMKRALPFYTWSRKNIPLQVESLINDPKKFIPIEKMIVTGDRENLNRIKHSNPNLYERLPAKFKQAVDTATYIPLEGLIPSADLSRIFRPQEMIFEMLSPVVKTPVELYLNKSAFTEREIESYPKETQQLLGMDLPVKLKYAITNLVPQARFVRMIESMITKKQNGEPLTVEEQAFQNSISTVYKINMEEAKSRAISKIQRDIKELRSNIKWQSRKGRDREVERINNTINETMDLLNDL